MADSVFLPDYKSSKSTKNYFEEPKTGYDTHKPAFSFKHIETEDKELFSIRTIEHKKDFYSLVEHLKGFSDLTWGEIKRNPRQFHAHDIDWNQSSHKGKKLPLVFTKFPAFQFKAFKECRIIGFFNDKNIFEIVWVDRDHVIYKEK